jgi:MarR family transcriptional regulator, organic hydroperoxide resistance regulator
MLEEPSSPDLTRALRVIRHVWAVDHAVRTLSRAMENHLGVTGPQRLVVRFAGRRPGITAGELATLLSLDASTLTGHLQRLEDLGMLERRGSHADGRRVEVFLTAKGKRIDVVTPGTVEAAVEAVLAASDDRDVAAVEAFLEHLVAEVEKQTAHVKPKPNAARSSKSSNSKKTGARTKKSASRRRS